MLGTNRLFSRLVAAMYVHVNQQIFEKRPVLGLLLGAFTLVFILLIWGALYHEYKGFGKVPEEVDFEGDHPTAAGSWEMGAHHAAADAAMRPRDSGVARLGRTMALWEGQRYVLSGARERVGPERTFGL
jgi:hypothetical protein